MNESPEAPRVDAEPPAAVISGTAAGPVADLLFQLLIEVVRRHRPDIEPVLRGGANIAGLTPELMARALQAQGIWFQLLSLAEQNAAMRRRRQVERTRGRDALRGTFAHVLAEAAADGVPAKEIQSLLSGLRIRPVITAHPTESKRVTVLEKYRRIYLLLRELEIPRWTERERNALIDDLRDQIELVWMTGELHLEKPTVQHEVSRGLHFFDETLFDKAPEMLGLVDVALEKNYRGESFELPPFFQFGSWIGGDRDGNPNAHCPCRKTFAPSSSARWPRPARRTRSRRAIPASPIANISPSCCGGSKPPWPASRARTSAARARLTPMPTS
jgi:phosphoenolpyruvate carboxylase